MARYTLAFFLMISVERTAWPAGAPRLAPQNEVRDTLATASALYYEAKFKESIDLLLHLDEVLGRQSGSLREKTGVKLQLALAYMGLNDAARARSRFDELYALDPDYSLDAKQYAPKVLTLAEEAKAEQIRMRTVRLCDDTRKQLESENAAAFADQILSMTSKCPDLRIFASKAADLFYKKGLEAYKRDELSSAMKQFSSALKLDPDHELAAQYTELIRQKLRVSADRLFVEWRRKFDVQDFAAAASAYRQLQSLNGESGVASLVDQTRSEYRKALSPFVESWSRACGTADTAAMENARKQATELLPELSIGEDILTQMTCAPKAAAKAGPEPAPKGCVQMDFQLAMVRLKTRVDPVPPPAAYNLLRRSPLTVRVKTRIEETGSVTVNQTQGENAAVNEAVRSAVQRWKFSPAIVHDEIRCVETEIPIVIRLDGTR